jgi:hypothetical protein
MKKGIALFVFIYLGLGLRAQVVYTITADSVKLTSCDSSELIIMNHTQNIPGFLFNTGNGRTVFKHALLPIGGGSYVIGGDTLNTAANAWVQGGNSWGQAGFFGVLDSNSINFYTNNLHRAQLSSRGTFSTDSDAVFHGVRVGIGAGRNPNNTVIGANALTGNPYGTGSVAMGYGAGQFAASNIVAIGYLTGQYATGGCTLLGFQTGQMERGNSLIAIGGSSGRYVDGGYDIAIGDNAMNFDSVTGWGNTAVGHLSAAKLSTGGYNTFLGQQSGDSLTTGTYNTIVGALAGGGLQTGSYNTVIGAQVTGLSNTVSNSIVLADGQGNQRLNATAVGDVGIGTSAPHSLFQVTQPAYNGTGMASVGTGTGTIMGVGTEFTNTFKVGDTITITTPGAVPPTSESQVVTAIASDVSMTTTPFAHWQNGYYYASSRNILEVKGNGFIGVATDTPTSKMDITGQNGYNQFRLRTSYTPTSSTDANGNVGDFSWDGNYLYIKTSSGWKRSALTTF